jgi:hypothetical protein
VEECEALAGVVALPQEQEREQEPEQEPEQGPERAEQEQGQEPELAEQEQKQELAEAVETLAGVKLQLRAGNGRLRVGHGKGHRVERRGRSLERRKRCGCLVWHLKMHGRAERTVQRVGLLKAGGESCAEQNSQPRSLLERRLV